MSDDKLRCALVYRMDAGLDATSSTVTMLAKHDHASDYESHGGTLTEGSLYGGKDKGYADAVALVVSNDPPAAGGEPGAIGGFKVVQSDLHQVVYGADSEGLCLAVITGLRYPSRIAIQMLVELYSQYSTEFAAQISTAEKGSLSKKSKPILSTICQKYSSTKDVDKASAITGKIDEVKVQMQDNIAGMLQNMEKTEDISEQADQLNEQASVFKKKSTDLKKTMRCKNLKMTLILVGLVVGILLVILIPVITRARASTGNNNNSSDGGENANP